jgi:CHASE2 domain-containing sensor protein/tRNA A-37 threonylcarbamoyl transferase component Bud32
LNIRSRGVARIALAAFAVFVLSWSAWRPWVSVNRIWQDALARSAPSLSASGNVVVVAIDEKVVSRIGPWPWDRGQTGKLFETIASLQPKVVGFDGYFPHHATPAPGDLALDSSLRRISASGVKLVLPFFVEGVGAPDSTRLSAHLPTDLVTSAFQLLQDKPELERSPFGRGRDVFYSDPRYQGSSAPAGFINNPADVEDGICRRVLHVARMGDEYLPSFAVALVAAYGDATLADVSLEPGLVQVRHTEIPVDASGFASVRFLGRGGTIPTIPAGDLLADPAKFRDRIRGRIVVIGLTAPGGVNAESGDFILTPLESTRYPGVELWATAVENILQGEIPRSTTAVRLWELLLGLGACGTLWWSFRRRGLDKNTVFVATAALFGVIVVQSLLDRLASVQTGVDLPLLGAALGLAGVRLWGPASARSAITLESPGSVAGQVTEAVLPAAAPSLSASMATPGAGGKVARFEIEGELGRGAMGVVLKGFDRALERHVAIKVLSATRRLGDRQDENLSRFQREAKAVAQLNHPSIVTIFEFGDWEGSSYIAMELLDGPALDKLLQEHRLPWKAVRAWGLQLAEALAYAHGRGVVHRDIKPANIMAVDQGRRVKLTDFGLARSSDSSLTQEGQILGTPYYMAPELIDGKKGDHLSDQYALGVVIYEMLSRRRPFEGDEVRQIMLQILMHPAPSIASVVSADVPPEALGLVDRLMAKRPEDRFPSLDDALEAWKRLPA